MKARGFYGDVRKLVLTVKEVKQEMGDGGRLWYVYPWSTYGKERLPSALGGLQSHLLEAAGWTKWPAETLPSSRILQLSMHCC